MGTITLSDIELTPLKRVETVGGDVLHGIKSSDKSYAGFGEAYFSWVMQDSIKAWKRHTKMTMNLIVPVGNVKFVFFEDANEIANKFRIEEIGENRYERITVPPGIWFGFQGIDYPQSLIMNIANIPHQASEVERLSLNKINYVWN